MTESTTRDQLTEYRKLKERKQPIESFKLLGLNGNAFALMGAFQREARSAGWNQEEILTVLAECKRADYDNLLRTLMDWEG